MRKGIIIIVLLLISVCIIPFVIFSLQLFSLRDIDINGNGVPPPKPTLQPIPIPDIDENINLKWSSVSGATAYRVYYRLQGTIDWTKIADVSGIITSYSCNVGPLYGEYEFAVRACNYYGTSPLSNIESVKVSRLPSNPSIIINDGAETTNSFEVTLTLYCDNADEMQFQISVGVWINWTAYSTTYIITLFENDPFKPDYRVGVVFRNEVGTTEDADYGDIYDDITYKLEEEPPPPPPNGDDKPVDYTLMYVLLGVFVGLVGIGIFLKYRKLGSLRSPSKKRKSIKTKTPKQKEKYKKKVEKRIKKGKGIGWGW